MIIRTHRRAGFSLTKALIAIFVMALGLMGVLSLFPLGAMHMLRPIRTITRPRGTTTPRRSSVNTGAIRSP